MAIIDTPHFQRLRGCRQLGTAFAVYPSATHSRFEHSLGVAHLAETLCRNLKEHRMPDGAQPPSEHDILCVKVAALCHDLGHGPYSHVFDASLVPALKDDLSDEEEKDELAKHTHEQLSFRLLIDLLEHIKEFIPKHEKHVKVLKAVDLDFIEELILGEAARARSEWRGRGKEKAYLYDVVSNIDSGLDVDKLDYLQRDPHEVGVQAFDAKRLLQSAQVRMVRRHDGQERPAICYARKAASEVLEVFRTRFKMHRECYTHRAVKGYELLLIDYLLAVDKLGGIYPRPRPRTVTGRPSMRLGQTVLAGNEHAFLLMTDEGVLTRCDILIAECEDAWADMPRESAERRDLARAKQLQGRVARRDLYKCLGTKEWEPNTTCAEQVEVIVKNVPLAAMQASMAKAITVEEWKCHYGKKAKNPVDEVRFFDKGDDVNALATPEKLDDANLPREFESKHFRAFFTGEGSAFEKDAERAVREWRKGKEVEEEPLFSQEVG